MQTTLGQFLINNSLPEDLRDYNRKLDKPGIDKLMQEVALKYPDKYRDISYKLSQVGWKASQDSGGMSFGLQHLRRSQVSLEISKKIKEEVRSLLNNDNLTDKQRNDAIVLAVGKHQERMIQAVYEEALESKNPLALQVRSGTRGKPMNLASLLGSDLLYQDARNEVIPIPILHSYSEGLTDPEYWAGTYGARRGVVANKLATADGGYLSKQLTRMAHRLIVTSLDEDTEDEDDELLPKIKGQNEFNLPRGYLVDSDDMESEGSLLAVDTGQYKRNTVLTPKILGDLKKAGHKRILIRSPIVGGPADGGLYARDVGVRETGKLPGLGEFVGKQVAQTVSEPITQSLLNAKHTGGVVGQDKTVSGFKAIDQMIQIPEKMVGGAVHAEADGYVSKIENAPGGGLILRIGDKSHYVEPGIDLKVKIGDEVEAGDAITSGIPSPANIVKHKGIGEGRRYFIQAFSDTLKNSGVSAHRRNLEVLSRSLINHVRLTQETGDYLPDDVLPYSLIEKTYKPRSDFQFLDVKKSRGKYLEQPVLHYTIGTKVRPSVIRELQDFGVSKIPVHNDPAPFESEMIRGAEQIRHDPDFLSKMYGGWLKDTVLTDVHRGATIDESGTSFVPSLAKGIGFGRTPGNKVQRPGEPFEPEAIKLSWDNGPGSGSGSNNLDLQTNNSGISASAIRSIKADVDSPKTPFLQNSNLSAADSTMKFEAPGKATAPNPSHMATMNARGAANSGGFGQAALSFLPLMAPLMSRLGDYFSGQGQAQATVPGAENGQPANLPPASGTDNTAQQPANGYTPGPPPVIEELSQPERQFFNTEQIQSDTVRQLEANESAPIDVSEDFGDPQTDILESPIGQAALLPALAYGARSIASKPGNIWDYLPAPRSWLRQGQRIAPNAAGFLKTVGLGTTRNTPWMQAASAGLDTYNLLRSEKSIDESLETFGEDVAKMTPLSQYAAVSSQPVTSSTYLTDAGFDFLVNGMGQGQDSGYANRAGDAESRLNSITSERYSRPESDVDRSIRAFGPRLPRETEQKIQEFTMGQVNKIRAAMKARASGYSNTPLTAEESASTARVFEDNNVPLIPVSQADTQRITASEYDRSSSFNRLPGTDPGQVQNGKLTTEGVNNMLENARRAKAGIKPLSDEFINSHPTDYIKNHRQNALGTETAIRDLKSTLLDPNSSPEEREEAQILLAYNQDRLKAFGQLEESSGQAQTDYMLSQAKTRDDYKPPRQTFDQWAQQSMERDLAPLNRLSLSGKPQEYRRELNRMLSGVSSSLDTLNYKLEQATTPQDRREIERLIEVNRSKLGILSTLQNSVQGGQGTAMSPTNSVAGN